jgi:hypothetical protein
MTFRTKTADDSRAAAPRFASSMSPRWTGIACYGELNFFIIEKDEKVLGKFELGSDWSVKGRVVKVIDTTHIADDRDAGRLASAELERIIGETKNTTLECTQLTANEIPFWSNKFVIYEPA